MKVRVIVEAGGWSPNGEPLTPELARQLHALGFRSDRGGHTDVMSGVLLLDAAQADVAAIARLWALLPPGAKG